MSVRNYLNTQGRNEGRISGHHLAIEVDSTMSLSYTDNGSILLSTTGGSGGVSPQNLFDNINVAGNLTKYLTLSTDVGGIKFYISNQAMIDYVDDNFYTKQYILDHYYTQTYINDHYYTQTYINDHFINVDQIGANNGVCGLDAGGKVPISNLPTAIMTYEGLFNATTNTPTLTQPNTNPNYNAGAVFIVQNTTDPAVWNGITLRNGDWLILDASNNWQKSENTDDLIISFNNRVGAVVPIEADYSDFFYTKSYIIGNYYTQTYITDHYYTQTYVNDNYYTKTYINDNYYTKTYITDNYYTQTYINDNFVNITGTQTITGLKTFNNQVIINTNINPLSVTNTSTTASNQLYLFRSTSTDLTPTIYGDYQIGSTSDMFKTRFTQQKVSATQNKFIIGLSSSSTINDFLTFFNDSVAGNRIDSSYQLKLLGGGTTITPVNSIDIANKAYCDTKLSLSGGTLTGALVLSGDPTVNLNPVTLQYLQNNYYTQTTSDTKYARLAFTNTFTQNNIFQNTTTFSNTITSTGALNINNNGILVTTNSGTPALVSLYNGSGAAVCGYSFRNTSTTTAPFYYFDLSNSSNDTYKYRTIVYKPNATTTTVDFELSTDGSASGGLYSFLTMNRTNPGGVANNYISITADTTFYNQLICNTSLTFNTTTNTPINCNYSGSATDIIISSLKNIGTGNNLMTDLSHSSTDAYKYRVVLSRDDSVKQSVLSYQLSTDNLTAGGLNEIYTITSTSAGGLRLNFMNFYYNVILASGQVSATPSNDNDIVNKIYLDNFVNIAGTQTITGSKTIQNTLNFNAILPNQIATSQRNSVGSLLRNDQSISTNDTYKHRTILNKVSSSLIRYTHYLTASTVLNEATDDYMTIEYNEVGPAFKIYLTYNTECEGTLRTIGNLICDAHAYLSTGTISTPPTNNTDIVNKLYIDNNYYNQTTSDNRYARLIFDNLFYGMNSFSNGLNTTIDPVIIYNHNNTTDINAIRINCKYNESNHTDISFFRSDDNFATYNSFIKIRARMFGAGAVRNHYRILSKNALSELTPFYIDHNGTTVNIYMNVGITNLLTTNITGLLTCSNQVRISSTDPNAFWSTYTGSGANVNIFSFFNNNSNANPYYYADIQNSNTGGVHQLRQAIYKQSDAINRYSLGLSSNASAPLVDFLYIYRDATASGNYFQFNYPCNFQANINANTYTGNISTLNYVGTKGRNLTASYTQNLKPIGQGWDSTSLYYIKNTYQTTTYGDIYNYIIFNRASPVMLNCSESSSGANKYNYYALRVKNASTGTQILNNFKFGISSYPTGLSGTNYQLGQFTATNANLQQFLFLGGFYKNVSYYYGFNDLTTEYSNPENTSISESGQYIFLFGWTFDWAAYTFQIVLKVINEATNAVTYSKNYAIPTSYAAWNSTSLTKWQNCYNIYPTIQMTASTVVNIDVLRNIDQTYYSALFPSNAVLNNVFD